MSYVTSHQASRAEQIYSTRNSKRGTLQFVPSVARPPNVHLRSVQPQANLLGSTLGLYIAYHLEKYYRHRREVRIIMYTVFWLN